MRRSLALPLLVLALVACGDDTSTAAATTGEPEPEPALAMEEPGPHPVGHATVTVEDAARARVLNVEIWYPADEAARAAAEGGEPLEGFATSDEEREQLVTLLQTAPSPGTGRVAHAARDAAPAAGGAWPTVAFSHCFNGVRFSVFSIAERLASHGVAVVAVDHAGGTLFDDLAGEAAPLGTEFLATRTGDVRFVLDRVLDGAATELPVSLRGRFDAGAVGVFGHSFGGVTAGKVLTEDARPRAGLALAVPMENPLLPGVTVADLQVPLLFLRAIEDNSITSIGNDFIQQNFDTAGGPAWKVDVEDAGHWSFTDICGIVEGFDAGCTDTDARMTTQEPFTYLDPVTARGIGAAYTTAFFLSTLTGDADASAYLALARPEGTVSVVQR